MNKEEILKNRELDLFANAQDLGWDAEDYINCVHGAMDDFSKQECIKFKIWCDENEGALGYAHGKSLSTEELYNFFKT